MDSSAIFINILPTYFTGSDRYGQYLSIPNHSITQTVYIIIAINYILHQVTFQWLSTKHSPHLFKLRNPNQKRICRHFIDNFTPYTLHLFMASWLHPSLLIEQHCLVNITQSNVLHVCHRDCKWCHYLQGMAHCCRYVTFVYCSSSYVPDVKQAPSMSVCPTSLYRLIWDCWQATKTCHEQGEELYVCRISWDGGCVFVKPDNNNL